MNTADRLNHPSDASSTNTSHHHPEEPASAKNQPGYSFDEILNSLDQGYCIIEMICDESSKPCDYRFIEVNLAFEKQTGLANAKGKTMKELVPDHDQYWFDIYGEVAVSGKPLRFQRFATQLNRHYDVYAFRIQSSEGNKVAVLFTDITDQKRAEDNLSFLFHLTRDMIDSSGTEDMIAKVGGSMSRHLLLSYFVIARLVEEGKKIEVLHSWHDAHLPPVSGVHTISDFLTGHMQQQLQQEIIVINNTQADIRVCHEKSKDLPVGSCISIPLKRNNKCEFLVFVCRNDTGGWRSDEISVVEEAVLITWTILEHQRAERDLYYSEERLRIAMETGHVGICDLNYQTGTSYCNDVRYTMYGMTPVSGQTPVEEFLSRTHPDDVEALLQKATLGIETAGKYAEEFRVVHGDGTVRWIYETGQVMEWADRKPLRVISTLVDITQQKTEEQQRDDFFKIASHELKSPLTNLKSIIYMLADEYSQSSNPVVHELNRQMERQIKRMNQLVGNMLDATRAAVGHLDYNMKPVNLLPLLQEVVEDLQHTTRTHRLLLSAISLPSIMGDELRLTQVFTNLISNAIKYTPSSSGHAPKDIHIEAGLIQNEIRISISDTGIGMSSGTKERLFERFFRSDAPEKHHYPGLGLGLYISKEIVQKHGGTITVQSQTGKGSTFTVALPAQS